MDWESVMRNLGLTLAAVAVPAGLALLAHWLAFSVAGRRAERSGRAHLTSLVRHLRAPMRAILLVVALMFGLSFAALPERVLGLSRSGLNLCLIASIAWLATRALLVGRDFLLSRYRIDVADNLAARRIHTQFRVIQRVAVVIIVLIAVAIMLTSIRQVREIGVSLLASAGVIGIIVGFSAQRTIATLFAGIQIAITQPIRLDDVVIVEGEWGWIEEITLTYVVVKIWDLRRLIVPITYFIERPFQNWTRVSADLLGTVFIYTDYTVPFDEVRRELRRILEATDLWDRKVCVLQVTNATEQTVELRALMSAPDSPKAWDLRCLVREKLIDFIKRNYPDSLPRTRVELSQETGPVGGAGTGKRGEPCSVEAPPTTPSS